MRDMDCINNEFSISGTIDHSCNNAAIYSESLKTALELS